MRYSSQRKTRWFPYEVYKIIVMIEQEKSISISGYGLVTTINNKNSIGQWHSLYTPLSLSYNIRCYYNQYML
jgi:hypothetical protein